MFALFGHFAWLCHVEAQTNYPTKQLAKGKRGKRNFAQLYKTFCAEAVPVSEHGTADVSFFCTYIPHKNKHTSCTEENYEQNA